jgi:hypothetical protein
MKRLVFILLIMLSQSITNECISQCLSCPEPVDPDSIIRIYAKLPFHSEPDSIWVTVKDSLLLYQGDMIVGTISQLKDTTQNSERGVYCDNCALWTNSTIPYVIGSGFSTAMLGQINFAIDYLNKSTNLCVIPKTNQTNYVKFVPSNGCNSWVGMIGGEQIINLDDIGDNFGCWYGSIAHEIIHAAGFWHEQSREDRDNFIDIFWNNIIPSTSSNFDKHVTDGQDIGNYDYASIMHYDAYAFSINGQPTIKRKNGATDLIGNRNYISGTDIEAINLLYDSKCSLCFDRKLKISPQSMVHSNIGHWEIDGALLFQDNTAFSTNGSSRAEFDSGAFIDIKPTATNSAPFEAVAGSVVEMSIEGCPGNVPTWYSFQSLNFPNRYIRHFNYYTQIDKIEDVLSSNPADANFKMVNGFDSNCTDCVAFESKNFPNYFLVVEGGAGSKVKIVANNSISNFAQKATFRLRSGFASANGISIESWFAQGNYINHNNFIIYIGAYQNDRAYRENATFRLTTGL